MSTLSDQRPDILMIMPDQMRGDCLSLENHPVLQTPNIDSIGHFGMHFTRAYTTCPSCIPARRAMLSGRFPANNGMVGYCENQELDLPTFPERLQREGYLTTLIGRHMHQHPFEKSYGFEDRLHASTYIEDDDYAQSLEAAFPGQGGVRGHGLSNNGWTSKSWQFPDRWHPTNWVATRVVEKIRAAPADKPHFITASFLAPHPPLLPPAFYYDRYRTAELPSRALGDWAVRPEGGARDQADKMDHVDLGSVSMVENNRVDLEGERLRNMQSGYFGLINQLDDQVFNMVSAFRVACEQRGRPWVILFTSDHGEMLGDHYLFRKCEPYEGSVRIPFLVQASPEFGLVKGGQHDRPVCLEDIGPTLLDLAGIAPDETLDGRSLLPVLRGEQAPVREILHSEHSPGYDLAQAYHMLTDGRMKYIWRPHRGAEQLFDLSVDPQECTNLATQSEHDTEVARWRDRLIARLKDRPEGFTDGEKLIAGRPYPDLLPTGK